MSLRAILVAVLVATTTLVSGLMSGFAAAPAQAVSYRYWTLWWGDNTGVPHQGWRFASSGASGLRVNDQAVLGWRFATSGVSGASRPRFAAAYADVCPSAPAAPEGQVRVAVAVDFGTASDWPPGERPPLTDRVLTRCVTVPVGSLASAAMSAADLPLRDQRGLICGIGGFPATECAPMLDEPAPKASEPGPAKPTPDRPKRAAAPAPSRSITTAPRASARPSATSANPAVVAQAQAAAPERDDSADEPAAVEDSSGQGSVTDRSVGAAEARPTVLPATTTLPATAAYATQDRDIPWETITGVALLVALGVGIVWTTRRRA